MLSSLKSVFFLLAAGEMALLAAKLREDFSKLDHRHQALEKNIIQNYYYLQYLNLTVVFHIIYARIIKMVIVKIRRKGEANN